MGDPKKAHPKNLLKNNLGWGIHKSTLVKHSVTPQRTNKIAKNTSSPSPGEKTVTGGSAGTASHSSRDSKPADAGTVRQ